MKKIVFLFLLAFLPICLYAPKKRKAADNQMIDAPSIQCPYCPIKLAHLNEHLLETHKIHTTVLADCAAAITAFNVIKKSRYKIASLPCDCGIFFKNAKALYNHQHSMNKCPLFSPAYYSPPKKSVSPTGDILDQLPDCNLEASSHQTEEKQAIRICLFRSPTCVKGESEPKDHNSPPDQCIPLSLDWGSLYTNN